MPIKIYADGADPKSILEFCENPMIQGFTTNPSLLRKAGVSNYEEFAKEILSKVKDKPFSFEVISDNWDDMEAEAEIISSWGENVYVKIPTMTTSGIKTTGLIKSLISKNIKVNLTCVFSYRQIDDAISVLGSTDSIISIFAGRMMDAGYDAPSFIRYAVYSKKAQQKILWASTRELFNIKQAEDAGADIITVGHDLLKKMHLIGKNLEEFSRETVQMFHDDAVKSGFKLL